MTTLHEDRAKVEKPIQDTPDIDGSLRELVEKNIKWSELIYQQNKKIKRRLTVIAVGDYIKLCLFLAPFILGAIYLPPLIREFTKTYSQFVGSSSAGLPLGDIGSIIEQFLPPGVSVDRFLESKQMNVGRPDQYSGKSPNPQ
ncbi:MAG: hypothetical protein HYY51_01325 [Candidatus Magasanikbacteria bacterium]|nr:hypothetical protein [Candidatus Magasanikbacteria bacterium]